VQARAFSWNHAVVPSRRSVVPARLTAAACLLAATAIGGCASSASGALGAQSFSSSAPDTHASSFEPSGAPTSASVVGSSPAPSSLLSKSFRWAAGSFAYPAAWQASTFPEDAGTFSQLIAIVSNEPVRDPCVTTSNSETCSGLGSSALGPGGVLAYWSQSGGPPPGNLLSAEPGNPTTIDGRSARIAVSPTPTACTGVANVGEVVQAAVIQSHTSGADELVEMTACIASPGAQQAVAQAVAMFTSIRLNAEPDEGDLQPSEPIPPVVSPSPSPLVAPSGPGGFKALSICEAVLKEPIVSASATTVGDIRAWSYGPAAPATGSSQPSGIQPAKGGFPGDAASYFAAWCWTGTPGDWVSWGVDTTGQKVKMAQIEGAMSGPPPTGGPAIP
jgi:hypothetical protein